MKRTIAGWLVTTTVFALVACPAYRAAADDETGDTAIKIHAPLTVAACGATPPSITVLGLTIDISTAAINTGDNEIRIRAPLTATSCSTTPPTIAVLGLTIDVSGAVSASECAALVAGNTVDVQFASDMTPLVATAVDTEGGDTQGGSGSQRDDGMGGGGSVEGPLQAVDVTNKTVQILGLTISVASATLGGGDDGSDDGNSQPVDLTQLTMGQFAAVQLDASQLPALVATALEVRPVSSCATLVVGNNVEVHFASDGTPLAATQVNDQGSDDQELSVAGPLQAIDTMNQTVTVLGLTIGVSGANLGGADDNSEDGNSQPVDLSQLMVGQFVAVHLDASQLPALVATQLEVKNFANQVEVDVDDAQGQPVNDGTGDVEVDVTETVMVATGGGAGGSGARHAKRVKRLLHFRAMSNGHVLLGGLPTGKAKIRVTRGTTTGHKGVSVKPNTMRTVKVHLR